MSQKIDSLNLEEVFRNNITLRLNHVQLDVESIVGQHFWDRNTIVKFIQINSSHETTTAGGNLQQHMLLNTHFYHLYKVHTASQGQSKAQGFVYITQNKQRSKIAGLDSRELHVYLHNLTEKCVTVIKTSVTHGHSAHG